MTNSNSKVDQIAKLSLINPSVDFIANELNTTRLSILGSYATLKKLGDATYDSGNIILTEVGIAKYKPTTVDLSTDKVKKVKKVLSELNITVTFKEGSYRESLHQIYQNNIGSTKKQLHDLIVNQLQMDSQKAYVVMGFYEKRSKVVYK